jgi:hypothetical protein
MTVLTASTHNVITNSLQHVLIHLSLLYVLKSLSGNGVQRCRALKCLVY